MHRGAREAVWVESPLQLVAAAEWAADRRALPDVAFRLTGPSMSATAAELLERGAPFASCVPYLGIPWSMLAGAREWVVGDALSGQFQTAMAVLRPYRVTLLDDGAVTLRTVEALLGRVPLLRPGRASRRMRPLLAELVCDRMAGLAARGRLAVHSVYAADEPVLALRGLGAEVTRNSFAWTRATALPDGLSRVEPVERPIRTPGLRDGAGAPSQPAGPSASGPASSVEPVETPDPRRILLGTALVVDGALTVQAHRHWVVERLRAGRALYLPHRREAGAVLEELRRLPGLTVSDSLLPVELLLAGAPNPLHISALPTSARRTLEAVLAGTGSTISETALAAIAERSPSR